MKQSSMEMGSGVVTAGALYELECLPGLEEFVAEEVLELLPSRSTLVGRPRPGRLLARVRGGAARLAAMRTAVAVHLLLHFEVPRPKALLGHEHFTRLVTAARTLVQDNGGGFASLRISAAGADSEVLRRFRTELARALGLEVGDAQADMLVSMRRPPDGSPGWDVLLRTTPRPLSNRRWRVCNMPGALNATAAHAMARLVADGPRAALVNVACGSGTLMVEYLERARASQAVGVDVSGEALTCAARNLAAAGIGAEALLLHGDATCLPLPDRYASALLADLPFGQLVGSAAANVRLYPAIMREAARVAKPGARFAVITASTRAFDAALADGGGAWRQRGTFRISVPHKSGYVTPVIYALERV